jgi:hypothetical protein
VLELFRVPDRLRLPFVSPDWERCLLTVAAAICFARLELRPACALTAEQEADRVIGSKSFLSGR